MCNQYESVVGSKVRYDGLTQTAERIAGQRVFPGFQVPIIRRDEGVRLLDAVDWAFVPAWARELPKVRPTNARAETVSTNGLFKSAFARSRCLFPCAFWVEWKGEKGSKIPHRLGRTDGEPFSLAGFWSETTIGGQPVRTACIVTTAANDAAAAVHHRMPLVLAPEDEEDWLDPATPTPLLLPLLRPASADWLLITPEERPSRRSAQLVTLLDEP